MVPPKFFRKASAVTATALMLVAQLGYAQEAKPEAKAVPQKAANQPAKSPPPAAARPAAPAPRPAAPAAPAPRPATPAPQQQQQHPQQQQQAPKQTPPPPAKPQPTPAKPEPTPAKPEPTPAKPQPTPAKPQPTPAKPQPTPAKPEPTPAKPQPTPAKPEPTPAKPEPTPAKPQPTPAKPTAPTGKPPVKPPTQPPAKPPTTTPPKPVAAKPQPIVHPAPAKPPTVIQPGSPEHEQALEQGKAQVAKQQQQQQQQSTQDLAKLKASSPAVAAKVPAGAQVKLSTNGKSVAVATKSADGTTTHQVLDAKTGKPLVSYSRSTGAKPTSPPAGAKTITGTDGSKTITAPGYQRVVERNGDATTTIHNTVIKETVVNNTTIINESVTVNKQVIVVHPDYPVVRTWDPVGGGYVSAYRPTWWGAPHDMQNNWRYDGGFGAPQYHVFGLFFNVGGFDFEVTTYNYHSPWRPGFGYVAWGNPYAFGEARWEGLYARPDWNWGWYAENYYPGYYTPFWNYSHLGWFVTDYRIQRELETERLERLAAYEDQAFIDAEAQEWIDNASVLNPNNASLAPGVFQTLVDQDQEIVNDIDTGQEVYAPFMVNENHIFTVNTNTPETVIDQFGNERQCKLKAGEFIQPDPNFDQDQEPLYDDEGLPVLDQYGNVEYTTYVTMKVVGSRWHSCKIGSDVVVQMSALQTMLDDEKARDQEAMEQSIVIGFQP